MILMKYKIEIFYSFIIIFQLLQLVNKIIYESINTANLSAIMLTGLTTTDCIDLFQAYIHLTNDIQTPAVTIVNSPLQNNVTRMWIET